MSVAPPGRAGNTLTPTPKRDDYNRRPGDAMPGGLDGRTTMTEQQVFEKVVAIIKPFVKNQEAFATVSMETSILKDLKVNSARLVDVVLEIEDAFNIEVKDDEADKVRTVGDAVKLILDRAK
jgi:acyl carrier protein